MITIRVAVLDGLPQETLPRKDPQALAAPTSSDPKGSVSSRGSVVQLAAWWFTQSQLPRRWRVLPPLALCSGNAYGNASLWCGLLDKMLIAVSSSQTILGTILSAQTLSVRLVRKSIQQ